LSAGRNRQFLASGPKRASNVLGVSEMKRSLLRNASLMCVGTLLFLVLPASSAFAIHHVSGVAPTALGRGATAVNLTVSGTGFLPTASVSFSGTGITKNSQTVNGGTSITVKLTISPTETVSSPAETVPNRQT